MACSSGLWKITRSPSSALLHFFGGAPTKIDYRKKMGTLILTSLLEDPDENSHKGRSQSRDSVRKTMGSCSLHLLAGREVPDEGRARFY